MSSQRIFLFTLLVHLSWFILFSFGGLHSSKPKKEKMTIVTKHYSPPKPALALTLAPTPTLTPKKIPLKKKPTATKKTPKKKSPLPSKQLLKKIDQTLTKIENPKTVNAPACVPAISSDPPSFFDQVAHTFQQTLTLPEKGAVKLTLSVQPNGKIVIIDLIYSENDSNLQYLKLMLPMITLPPPEGGKEQTFMITFCND